MTGYSISWKMNAQFKKFCEKKLKHPDHFVALHTKDCITPITVLLGPNGTGKSMSLLNIEYDCKAENIECVKYSNKCNDIVASSLGMDINDLVYAFASEGERIVASINNWANRNMLRPLLTNEEDIYILIDELDSGLSADRLYEKIFECLDILKMEKEKHPNRNVKMVFTCNTWEMLECFKNDNRVTVYWVPTKQKLDLSEGSYEKFRNMYIEYHNYMRKDEDED